MKWQDADQINGKPGLDVSASDQLIVVNHVVRFLVVVGRIETNDHVNREKDVDTVVQDSHPADLILIVTEGDMQRCDDAS